MSKTKMKKLKTVDDVLRWAFDILGVKGLINDNGCTCEGDNLFKCEEPQGDCELAIVKECNPDTCDVPCDAFYDRYDKLAYCCSSEPVSPPLYKEARGDNE